MNRRQFLGTSALAGASVAAGSMVDIDSTPPPTDPKGPYCIEIISPPEHSSRELPLFDSYKQAENFAQARMHILRTNDMYLYNRGGGYINTMGDHEAGLIKVWATNDGTNHQVVYECAWGETWTMAYSYVDAKGRRA